MLSHPIHDNDRCKKSTDKGRALDDVGKMGIRGSPMMSGVWQYRGRYNCHHGSFAGRAFFCSDKRIVGINVNIWRTEGMFAGN